MPRELVKHHVWGCFWKRSAFEWRGAESRSPLPIHVWGLHPINGSLSRAGRWRRGPALVWAQTQSPLALRHECPILRSSDSGGLKPAALWVSSCSGRAETSQSPWLCGPISRLNLVLYIGSVPLDNTNTRVCVQYRSQIFLDLGWGYVLKKNHNFKISLMQKVAHTLDLLNIIAYLAPTT